MEYHFQTGYSPWYRFRVQAAGGLMAAVLPYLLRLAWGGPGLLTTDSMPMLHMTFILSLASIMGGTLILRTVARYPGVEGSAAILPAFSVTFGLVLLLLVMGRIEYNRFVLAGSYFTSVLWFYIVHFKEQRRPLRVGVISDNPIDPTLNDISRVIAVPISSPTANISVDVIAVDLRIDLSDEWERSLADYALSGTPVLHIKHLVESLTGRIALEHLSETSYGTLSPSGFYLTTKQVMDWFAAIAASILLAPFLIMLAIVIRIDSRGPAIFKQQRMGYRGKPFTVYKFRTMTSNQQNAGERTAAMTQDNDARVTRIGAFLRQSRIDELAQIFNILRGEMSWIGPRPEAEVLSRWYESDIPFYRYRHIVRPGITGWAQVNQGHVAEINEVTDKLHYDFYYIKNFTPWLDMLIVARTIKTMLTGFGAR